MTKKIFAISLLLFVMIILSLMPIPGSLSGVKEEEQQQQVIEGKIQQQQLAYAANATSATASSSSLLPSTTTNFNFAAVGDWGCTDHTTDTIKNNKTKIQNLY